MAALVACMPALMASLASSLVCCCSSAACSCCFRTTKFKTSTATRFAYAAMFLAVTIFAWTMETGWLDSLLLNIPYYAVQCPDGRCAGTPAVFRVMSALVVFHVLMSLALIGVQSSRDARAGLQNGWWGPKILVWMLIAFAFFFVPNDPFHYYGIFAFVGASFFIFIQLVLLLDFACNWSESWVSKWEETGSKKWAFGLSASAGAMLLSSLVAVILMFIFFAKSGCGLNAFFVSFHLICSLIVTALAVHPKIQEHKPSSGLLQPSVVVLYATYLVGSALTGQPNTDEYACNPLESDGARTTATIFGTLITFVSIVYSTTRAAANSNALMAPEAADSGAGGGDESVVPLLVQPVGEEMTNPAAADLEDAAARRRRLLNEAIEEGGLPKSAADDSDDDDDVLARSDDERHLCAYNYSYFHLVFALACTYMSMLLSAWNTVESGTGDLVSVGHDWTSVWVKIVSSWIAFVLFVWTLVAPMIFPDREWS